jgi:SAM-dependent methyltransferase
MVANTWPPACSDCVNIITSPLRKPMPNAYGDFSEYYDLLGWNAFARNAAVRLKAFFKLCGPIPRSVLDLACGTGELERSLRNTGIKFVGVDASPWMVKIARKKAPECRFIVADAAAVRLRRKFDMVLLLFDSANHMASFSHLRRVFRNARRHLRDDGYFIFDFLTEHGLEEWEQINIRRKKDYTLFWYGHYYPEKMLADIFIEAFIRQPVQRGPHENYRRVFQKIVEKTYPVNDIVFLLTECGFAKIAASPFDLDEKVAQATRLWFVCRK